MNIPRELHARGFAEEGVCISGNVVYYITGATRRHTTKNKKVWDSFEFL
jgi:hypothetical protein